MVWSHELPSTSFGDLEALASNVPALSEAGSFKKNGFEGDTHVEFSDKGLHYFFVEQVGPITLSRNPFERAYLISKCRPLSRTFSSTMSLSAYFPLLQSLKASNLLAATV